MNHIAIGTASAALQIEGSMPANPWNGWARDGHVADGTSPNPTTDHWMRWKEDNEIMASLGFSIARIGIEWARIEPVRGQFDADALARYREEIEDLRSKKIAPLVTLHHFGHPQWFEDMGAFTKDENIDLWLRFCGRVLDAVGDLVDDWITINEPNVYVTQAYLFKETPPGEVSWPKLRSTLKNMARAHCKAYRLIHDKLDGDGRDIKVTFANHRRVFAPMNPKNPIHQLFTKIDHALFHTIYEKAFYTGVFSPILGKAKDISPGLYADAIAINYYSRTAVTGMTDEVFPNVPTTDLGWEIYPEGIVEIGQDLYNSYKLPIWITENGCCDNPDPRTGQVEKFRCDFVMAHLEAMQESDLPFERYYHWCFVDNWEWSEGMVARFGIVHLGENLERTLKPSARMLSEVNKAGRVTDEIRTKYSEGSPWAK